MSISRATPSPQPLASPLAALVDRGPALVDGALPSGADCGLEAPTEAGRMQVDAATLRQLQAPLKERYRNEPDSAVVTLSAVGEVDGAGVACRVRTASALVEAGLHPASGGDGTQLCSGDMLLEALVACAGVTLRAVATAMEVAVRGGTVRAEGDLDFRGTLGVDRQATVGFQEIRVDIVLDTDADDEQLGALAKRTERYCVVYQTLRGGVAVNMQLRRG